MYTIALAVGSEILIGLPLLNMKKKITQSHHKTLLALVTVVKS
jgi:hypothetical protein